MKKSYIRPEAEIIRLDARESLMLVGSSIKVDSDNRADQGQFSHRNEGWNSEAWSSPED